MLVSFSFSVCAVICTDCAIALSHSSISRFSKYPFVHDFGL